MSMIIKEVALEELKDLPPTLYKYRTWTDKWHKTILTSQSVYLARPTSFEDPRDCKLLKRDDLLTPVDIWEKYYNLGKKQNPNWDELDLRRYATEWFWKSAMHDRNYIREHQEKYFQDFDKRFGVLSLTANPENHSMWLKYADDHRGFCVGFHPLILFGHLGGGGQVQYYDVLPDIMPFASDEEEHLLQVFSKEKKWEFEQEYRTHMFWETTVSEKERTKKLSNECYKEIIFGARMPENYRKEIVKLCKSKGLTISFYQEEHNSIDNTVKLSSVSLD